jgi:hypothetical protein
MSPQATTVPVLRTLRASAPVLAILMALASGAASLAPEPVDIPGSYLTADHTTPGLPTGIGSLLGLDGPVPDRSRERGPHPHRGSLASHRASAIATDAATTPPPRAPEQSAALALDRAGRRAAPSTAPPAPS